MSGVIFENIRVWDANRPEPVDSSVFVADGHIREVSDRPIRSDGAMRVNGRGNLLMPGLIDCHVHVTLSELNLRNLVDVPLTMMTALAARNMKETLDRGFTTVRDCGGADNGLAWAVETGLFDGPRMFVSGRPLTQTGGHGDFRPQTENREGCRTSCALDMQSRLADGVSAVRAAARDELRKGADHVKVMVSGGVASPNDPIDNTQYSRSELTAIVEEAEAWNTYVVAHSYTSNSTRMSLECGVRSIEHGNLIDRATADLIARHDAYLVPTLAAYEMLDQLGDSLGLPEVSIQKLQRVKDAGLQAIDHCRSAGAHVGFGTDLLGDLRKYQARGLAMQGKVQSPREVLTSATLVNAEILNQPGKLGVIEIGAIADLLLVQGDPLTDLGVFDDEGSQIRVIMKDGRFEKFQLD